MNEITTQPFAVSPSQIARIELTILVRRYGLYIALVLLIPTIASVADWRWLIVALAMMCVIIPTASMFTGFILTTRPDAIRQMQQHKIRINRDQTAIHYEQSDTVRTIPPEAITSIEVTSRLLILHHNEGNQKGLIVIPLEAFHKSDDVVAVCAFFQSKGIL